MARVEVTMEKTLWIAMEFDATEEQVDMLKHGKNPFREEMENKLENGNIEYDYAAVDLDNNEDLRSWNWGR